MLDNLAHNHAHRNPTASLYELGTIYTPTVKDGKADPDVLPHEEKILTLGSYGRLSFFQFKGAIEALLRELNIKGASFAPEKANPSYHPGRCAKVLIDGKEIGVFGTIHPTVAARYGLSGEVRCRAADGRTSGCHRPGEALSSAAQVPGFHPRYRGSG